MAPKFVTQDDVTDRFEGTIPSGRLAWVDKRILDVEYELMGKVPSLRKTVADINTESIANGDPDRIERVKTLIADKVLDLYRHPDGANQLSRTTPDITVSRTWSPDMTRGRVAFTPDELDRVRLRIRRRRFGTIKVAPFQPTQRTYP
ncbi:hypothetical protein [Mycobacterium marinum]|uniref:hypothetical protein n=1 Tax=Mycobacterium marinum TaxID=1781 RepID=UPI0021C32D70|nr:hypothetical protein [Mycobacterium marinum]GJO41965.1 hypothetical protein NJB1604_15070 [Mycobacterium marinum]